MEKVFVPADPREKQLQRALLQYYKPENRRLCIEALIRAGREDLIGNGPGKLIQPDQEYLRRRGSRAGKAAPGKERRKKQQRQGQKPPCRKGGRP